MPILDNLKKRVRHLKSETFALYLAARHPETPWYAKVFVAGVVAYAFSPIDLIPDFVPVLGFIAAAVIIGIWLLLAALCTLWAYEVFAINAQYGKVEPW